MDRDRKGEERLHLQNLNESDCEVKINQVSEMECGRHEETNRHEFSNVEMPCDHFLGLHNLDHL